MRTGQKSPLLVAVIVLAVATLTCNRSTPTVTPVPPLPTLAPPTPPPSMIAPTSPMPPTPSPAPTSLPATDTPIPPPPPTPTPVIPHACPAPGDPIPPQRPTSFSEYPDVLAAYLTAGGNVQGLEHLLRDWRAITDDLGEVKSLDLTGDINPEIVVALIDPATEFDLPWSPGDVLIFQCRAGTVIPVYEGRLNTDQDLTDLQFTLHEINDVNDTGRADVVYVTSSCGAHTCWDRLYIVEWNGTGFVNRIPDMEDYPHAGFIVDSSQILVNVGGIASAGAGYQRSYQETWEWDGRLFVITENIVGPPTALIHYIHNGDTALAHSDYGEAINHYQAALDETSLPTGLFLETEELSVIVIKAYARFKLMVVYTASGDKRRAQAQYDLLMAEHPSGTSTHPYALMGQSFWSDYLANGKLASACAAAVAIAENNPYLAEHLYAGYANPSYEPADLCRIDS